MYDRCMGNVCLGVHVVLSFYLYMTSGSKLRLLGFVASTFTCLSGQFSGLFGGGVGNRVSCIPG